MRSSTRRGISHVCLTDDSGNDLVYGTSTPEGERIDYDMPDSGGCGLADGEGYGIRVYGDDSCTQYDLMWLATWDEPDCNGNGIPDETDIGTGASVDCQPDGISRRVPGRPGRPGIRRPGAAQHECRRGFRE